MAPRNNPPPEKWNKYTAIKDVIEGTRFLPFKTPFSRGVRTPTGKVENFNVSDLLRRVGNLGLVLNLVKTDRYYNPGAYKPKGVEHYRMPLMGHGDLPSKEEIMIIFDVLDRFVQTNKDDEVKLLGVHCTHGVNRTGYIICRYMIEKLGFEPEDAIERFESGRGHSFDHEKYVDHLHTLKASEDPECKRWHSIGGKIVTPPKEEEVEFDYEKFETDSRPERTHNDRSSSRGERRREESPPRRDSRRDDDSDRHRIRSYHSSSSRSRHSDRSRSSSRNSARDYGSYNDRASYSSDRYYQYLGPRARRGSFRSSEKYLGPHRPDRWSSWTDY